MCFLCMFLTRFLLIFPSFSNILVRRIDPVNGGPDYQVVLVRILYIFFISFFHRFPNQIFAD